MVAVAELTLVQEPAKPLKLDLGAGKSKKGPDWTSVDVRKFDGVDVVADLTQPWPWPDGSVAEVHASHVLEHFEAKERFHFMNELYRVLTPGSQAHIVTPHWGSCRAYGDLTHKWPPVAEMFWYYLSREWRAVNAPHTDAEWNQDGLRCNFAVTWGYTLNPDVAVRDAKFQQFAQQYFKEAMQDMVATLIKT